MKQDFLLFRIIPVMCILFLCGSVLRGSDIKRILLENFTKLPNFHKSSILQHFKPVRMDETTPAVFLVHGLFMNGYHMSYLAWKLRNQGYYCMTYDYPTRIKTISAHGKDFQDVLERFCRENPRRSVHIITHSMGGLLTRYAVGNLPAEKRKNIKSILMLAPPNHGSATADLVCRYLSRLSACFRPVPGMQTHLGSECRTLPLIPEEIRLGILAASHDHLVKVHSARLEGMDHFELVRVQTHSSMPFSPKVYEKVKAFLKESETTP